MIFPMKERSMTHKITPALLTNIYQVLFSLARNRVFHEKLESQNYTIWGCTPEICWGINFGQRYTQQPQQLHTKIFLGTQ